VNWCGILSIAELSLLRNSAHYRILPPFNTTNLEMTYAMARVLNDAGLSGYIQISSNNLRLSIPTRA
jgi:hypothetical protein